jgi:hypothetical protein
MMDQPWRWAAHDERLAEGSERQLLVQPIRHGHRQLAGL